MAASIPAVLAPLFLRTRFHATTRKAGSATRLNRSSKRRSASAAAQRCNLVWIFSTRCSAKIGWRTKASIFTGASSDIPVSFLAHSLPPFPMWSALPTSEYYGGSVPSRPVRSTTDPARTRPGWLPGLGAGPRRFPCSPATDRRGRCPTRPRRPLASCRSTSGQTVQDPLTETWTGGCLVTEQPRTAPRPASARLESVPANEASNAGSSRAPSRHARRTRTIWQCWHDPTSSGLLPPFPASPGSGCPQLHRPAATGRR